VQTEIVLVAGKMGKVYGYRADNGQPLWTRSVGKHENDIGLLPRKTVTVFPGDLGGVETPMALGDQRLFVPWSDIANHVNSTGLAGGIAGFNLKAGRGGFTALDPASGKVLWQRKLPVPDFGAATVANDVVFTSTYDGTIYAFDTNTGKTLWTVKAPAGINSFPAIDGDTLLVGAGTAGFDKKPKDELIAYALPPQPASAAKAHAAASTIPVSGKEFSFKLGTKSVGRPGKATFTFKNTGHVQHDFKIDGKTTPRIGPGKTARLTVTFKKKGTYRYECTVPGHAAAGMKGVFTVR
jgi:plastocyanin